MGEGYLRYLEVTERWLELSQGDSRWLGDDSTWLKVTKVDLVGVGNCAYILRMISLFDSIHMNIHIKIHMKIHMDFDIICKILEFPIEMTCTSLMYSYHENQGCQNETGMSNNELSEFKRIWESLKEFETGRFSPKLNFEESNYHLWSSLKIMTRGFLRSLNAKTVSKNPPWLPGAGYTRV